MDYHLISVCSPVDKKRKLTEDASDNISMMPTTPMTRGGLSRHFLSIPRSDNVFQTEDWRSGDSALFLPLQEDLMVNVRKVEQVSCTEGQYFVADHSEKYSRSLSGEESLFLLLLCEMLSVLRGSTLWLTTRGSTPDHCQVRNPCKQQ
ncbi:hypothetical protein ACOMHN_040517 [Nucella lapillus]